MFVSVQSASVKSSDDNDIFVLASSTNSPVGVRAVSKTDDDTSPAVADALSM